MRVIYFVFVSILLFGCEKYEEPSDIRLTGGKWIFTDYDIVVTSSISSVSVIKSDTICINSFNNQSFVSGGIRMGQNYANTSKDRRFVRGRTIWEFDSNNNELFCDFKINNGSLSPSHQPYWVDLKQYSKQLAVTNGDIGSVTNYTFDTNSIGSEYSTVLTLLSPPIVTDLYLSNGSRDKAVTVRILLRFMR